jgi:hypothetical protein
MQTAEEIMQGFVVRTGLDAREIPSKRYLWTDAFAVLNFLGFYAEKGDSQALASALSLIDETHRVLGRHREDDPRPGWLSGLDEEDALQHPTVAGLRIGKERPERRASEPYDPSREWDRDGQYFHYLTKWMHALGCAARVTEEAQYHRWAVELARTAFARFAVFDSTDSPVALRWKMSIDLQRALVPTMGQHDPLDGFITYTALDSWPGGSGGGQDSGLRREIGDLARLCRGCDWYTGDSLGIGGLLTSAHELAKLMEEGVLDEPELLESLLDASSSGLRVVVTQRQLEMPAAQRLPFRELGLAIGLRAAQRIHSRSAGVWLAAHNGDALRRVIDSLVRQTGLASTIEEFWRDPENRRSPTWNDHREINEVMLATALAPHGYLDV